jgi:hypothetical protein
MSERELHRIEVLSEVVEGRRTLASAAIVLRRRIRTIISSPGGSRARWNFGAILLRADKQRRPHIYVR